MKTQHQVTKGPTPVASIVLAGYKYLGKLRAERKQSLLPGDTVKYQQQGELLVLDLDEICYQRNSTWTLPINLEAIKITPTKGIWKIHIFYVTFHGGILVPNAGLYNDIYIPF